MSDEVLRSADLDALTGVLSRGAFHEWVADVVRRAGTDHTPVSLLSIDLDGFRRVNTRFGMSGGDRILVETARLMEATLSGVGVLGRTGGDRFGALLLNSDLEQAVGVGEALRRAVEGWRWSEPIGGGTAELVLTISVGASSTDPDDPNVDRLVENADRALHQAQREGKNRIATVEAITFVKSMLAESAGFEEE